jgi:hypothetical protein
MELSFAARKEMQDVGARFAAARFPNIWQWTFGVREDVADELPPRAHLEGRRQRLVSPERAGSELGTGRPWARGRVLSEMQRRRALGKGRAARARAECHVCGVGWFEDTTVEPFVPRY